MAKIENLEWTACDELLDDLLTNPKVQLPQLIKLSQNINSVDGKEQLEKDQLIVIHEKHTVAKLEGESSKRQKIRLPVDCPYKVQLKIPPGEEQIYDNLDILAKTDPLPKFVEVTSVDGLESVVVGDRLKVVIAEKSGGIPSFVHFRSSSGKHVKISVDQNVSFKLAVNDASEQLLSKIAEKSHELPVAAQFVKNQGVPNSHLDLGVFTITKGFVEQVIIASALKSEEQYVLVFPLSSSIQFQVNSKLKMANDKDYRGLCTTYCNIDTSQVIEYLNIISPIDKETLYIAKFKKLTKLLSGSHESIVSHNGTENSQGKKVECSDSESEEKQCTAKGNTLTLHQDQQEIIKREQKEKGQRIKIEKERLKAERKREKKEKKDREKEEKKKKKNTLQLQKSEDVPKDDMYIMPNSPTASPSSPVGDDNEDSHQTQWASQFMSKVKNVKQRTRSFGFKPKKKDKLRKEVTSFSSADQIAASNQEHISSYTGLPDDIFTKEESLYETLPGDMAYESLDLIQQARRSLAPKLAENSGDSGFDEIDQAKIKAWRESMQPPPLPGNHPHQHQIDHLNDPNNHDIYEVAVDSASMKGVQESALRNFYSIVEQSTKEISTWGMEDVSECLQDLKLGHYKQKFIDSYVDGQLLVDLDESVLIDLGLTLFESRKLRKFVYGWRPDALRPPSYPKQKGYSSADPVDWTEKDVVEHLKVIDINDVSGFCQANQVNGELLKDICVDDIMMNSIITTHDRKLKIVKIKNYVIDQWRPKKKGEGNYISFTHVNQSALVNQSAQPHKVFSNQSNSSSTSSGSPSQPSNDVAKNTGSPTTGRNVRDNNAQSGIRKKNVSGDAPLIARMKQQLEENSQSWQNKKHYDCI